MALGVLAEGEHSVLEVLPGAGWPKGAGSGVSPVSWPSPCCLTLPCRTAPPGAVTACGWVLVLREWWVGSGDGVGSPGAPWGQGCCSPSLGSGVGVEAVGVGWQG